MLLTSTAHAEINEKYSFKGFTNQTFLDVDPAEFNDTEIKGSSFYQESAYSDKGLDASPPDPMVDVFPVGMTGVTFTRCNLDNVKIPVGNTIGERNNHRRIRIQNDLSDWVLDVNSKPTTAIDEDSRIRASVSIDPKDIPATKQDKSILEGK